MQAYRNERALAHCSRKGASRLGPARLPTSMGFTVMVRAESSQSISLSFPASWSRTVRWCAARMRNTPKMIMKTRKLTHTTMTTVAVLGTTASRGRGELGPGRAPPGQRSHPLPQPRRLTCKGVRIGQVVARQVNEGAMLRVDELRLCGHVAGMFDGAGCVDHVDLWQGWVSGQHSQDPSMSRTAREHAGQAAGSGES